MTPSSEKVLLFAAFKVSNFAKKTFLLKGICMKRQSGNMTVAKTGLPPFFNPFMLRTLLLNSLDQSISNRKGVWLFFNITIFYRNSCF